MGGPPTVRARLLSIAGWAAPPAAFLILASAWIGLPGPGPDEALFAQALFPSPPGGPAWKTSIFGHDVPVMLMPYLGALKAWLYVPVVAAFGTGPGALRLPMIALGAATILVFFGLVKRWAGGTAALLAAWLLATDPTFVWTTRCDWGPAALQRFLSVAGCGLIWRWSQLGGHWRLFGGFFLFGLGLFDKLTFHWLLIGYAAAAAAVLGRRALATVTPWTAAIALAGLTLGASPYLAYRFQSGPQGPKLEWETDAARYQQKWWMLRRTLEGTVARGFMIASEAPAGAPSEGAVDDALESVFGPDLHEGSAISLLPWAVLGAMLLLPWTQSPAARFSAAFCIVALAAMAPVRDAGAVHHQALMLPYPQLLVAATLAWWAAKGRLARGAAIAAFVAILASNLITLGSLYRDALRLGGTGEWSEAAYDLAKYLEERHPRFAVSLDWGIDNPQRFLLAHRPPVQPLAFPWDWADQGTVERLEQEMRQGGVVFLGRADAGGRRHPESWEGALAAAARAGLRLEQTREIMDRQGRAIFQVFETRPEP